MRNNKKGFTLVELLAVIVILAVVMLIAVTSVGPMMEKSRKGALGTEGVAMVDAAKSAFSAEQMNSTGFVKANSTVCFDYGFLAAKNYLEGKPKYVGSVLVTRTSSAYNYHFWLSNGTYSFGLTTGTDGKATGIDTTGLDPNTYNTDSAIDYDGTHDAFVSAKDSSGINTCAKVLADNLETGKKPISKVVYCTATYDASAGTYSNPVCYDQGA